MSQTPNKDETVELKGVQAHGKVGSVSSKPSKGLAGMLAYMAEIATRVVVHVMLILASSVAVSLLFQGAWGSARFLTAASVVAAGLAALAFELSLGAILEKIQAAAKTKHAVAKELALSLTYLVHLKRQHSRTKLALLGCAAGLAAVSFRFPELLKPALVSILFWILIEAKELLVEYRIRKGLFGTNRTEARDLINFIVKNSSDIDFTDSNGKLRRVLLPEESNARDPAPGTAHGGVTA